MPRLPLTPRVSLNQIRDVLGNYQLKNLRDQDLIDAFLPKWREYAFGRQTGISADTVRNNIRCFCGGNRKGLERLGNVDELNAICDLLLHNSQFVCNALNLSRNWVEANPPVKQDNAVFTSFDLCSRGKPTEEEQKQFAQIAATLAALREKNTVESLSYALFLLVIVGVLQEKIVEVPHLYNPQCALDNNVFLREALATGKKSLSPEQVHNEANRNLYKDGYTFLSEILNCYSPKMIHSIDMAFHGGDFWLLDGKRAYLLQKIAESGIHLRILVNASSAVDKIAVHMRQEFKVYIGFTRSIELWKEKKAQYPNSIEVRVLDVPLLHRTYLVRKDDGTGVANVTFYTYGNYLPGNDISVFWEDTDKEYRKIANEFDYLWELAGMSETKSKS